MQCRRDEEHGLQIPGNGIEEILMNGSLPLFDWVIIISAAYLLIMAVRMKVTGEVPSALISKNIVITKKMNVTGYIQAVFLPTFILGIIGIISGITGLMEGKVSYWFYIKIGSLALFLLGTILYALFTVKAQKKYLQ